MLFYSKRQNAPLLVLFDLLKSSSEVLLYNKAKMYPTGALQPVTELFWSAVL